jgi:hypothetical protein
MTFNMAGANTIELQSGFTLSVQTVKFTSAVTATGVGIPLWGANCPAGTLSAPYTWIRVIAPDGSVVFIPAYK